MDYFYIVTNQTKDPGQEVTEHIRNYLEARGKICTATAGEAECVLVLGGDGTLLRAVTELAHIQVPFLGINLGNMGFLAEVERGSIDQALDLLIADAFAIENRMMLRGAVTIGDSSGFRLGENLAGSPTGDSEEHSLSLSQRRGMTSLTGKPEADSGNGFSENDPYSNLALNDIVILGKKSMQLMCFNLYVNGLLLHRYAADGMIISTPTGSTGYNLSAGGPIVEPRAEALLLTPLSPHSLNSRSMILSVEDRVMLEIDRDKSGGRQEAEVVFDGNRRVALLTGDRVTVSKAEKVTAIIKLSATNFLQLLHRKMSD